MGVLRVVLDTSIVVAGLRSRRGASHQILREIPRRSFVMLLSVPLIAEYEATLKRANIRKEHGLQTAEIDGLLALWTRFAHPVMRHFAWRPQLRDPNDEMVLETAVNGRANAIVTFNEADFRPAEERFGVQVWRPAALLERLRERP
jgi:putative PIN family toxin of toxin-antitoxin system